MQYEHMHKVIFNCVKREWLTKMFLHNLIVNYIVSHIKRQPNIVKIRKDVDDLVSCIYVAFKSSWIIRHFRQVVFFIFYHFYRHILLLLSTIYIRRKYCSRENFRLPSFNGFKSCGTFWTRFVYFLDHLCLLSLLVC